MTTAYTPEELSEFEAQFFADLPRVPVQEDLEQLPMVATLACAAAPTGLLVRLLMSDGDSVPLFLNPFVAVELLDRIAMCAADGGWKDQVAALATEQPAAQVTPEDGRTANDVVSLTTASAGELVLIHLARRGGSQQMIGVNRSQATDLAVAINMAGERFGWWDEGFSLLPADGASARITNKEVWTAAQHLFRRFPADPEMEAAQRADAAYALGDMFNFDLWTRVSNAVRELGRTKPVGEEKLN